MRREQKQELAHGQEVERLVQLLKSGHLKHPYYHRQGPLETYNFTHLAGALAACCGAAPHHDDAINSNHQQEELVRRIGGTTPRQRRRHIILILCDGMGRNILDRHLPDKTCFLHAHQQDDVDLRAVFPSTTPAALTTLATAQWPGQHGVPGWDLREQQGCEYPGEARSLTQIRILADHVTNYRTHEPEESLSLDEIFVQEPWSRRVIEPENVNDHRKLIYISAYSESTANPSASITGRKKAPEFSVWQTGRGRNQSREQSLLETSAIGETSFETLGKPEGSEKAVEYFRDGVNQALGAIAEAEAAGQSTFVYLYTAHPDKHMHALGIDHTEVSKVVQGINLEVERLWKILGNRRTLMGMGGQGRSGCSDNQNRVDASLVVTADHGHTTVEPKDMVPLPEEIEACLDYANVGVHGKVGTLGSHHDCFSASISFTPTNSS